MTKNLVWFNEGVEAEGEADILITVTWLRSLRRILLWGWLIVSPQFSIKNHNFRNICMWYCRRMELEHWCYIKVSLNWHNWGGPRYYSSAEDVRFQFHFSWLFCSQHKTCLQVSSKSSKLKFSWLSILNHIWLAIITESIIRHIITLLYAAIHVVYSELNLSHNLSVCKQMLPS